MLALVVFVAAVGFRSVGHVHLAADNRSEHLGLLFLDLPFDFVGSRTFRRSGACLDLFEELFQILDFGQYGLVLLVDVVCEFLDTVHYAVIRQRHTRHAVLYGFVDDARHGGLAVEKRILTMYMQVNKLTHDWCNKEVSRLQS